MGHRFRAASFAICFVTCCLLLAGAFAVKADPQQGAGNTPTFTGSDGQERLNLYYEPAVDDAGDCANARSFLISGGHRPAEEVSKMTCAHAKIVAGIYGWKSSQEIHDEWVRQQQAAAQQAAFEAHMAQMREQAEQQRLHNGAVQAAQRAKNQQQFEQTMKGLKSNSNTLGTFGGPSMPQKLFNAAQGDGTPKGTGIVGSEAKMAIDHTTETFQGWGNVLQSPETIILPQIQKQFAQPRLAEQGDGSGSTGVGNPNAPYPFSANGAWPNYPPSPQQVEDQRRFEEQMQREQQQAATEDQARQAANVQHQLQIIDMVLGPNSGTERPPVAPSPRGAVSPANDPNRADRVVRPSGNVAASPQASPELRTSDKLEMLDQILGVTETNRSATAPDKAAARP